MLCILFFCVICEKKYVILYLSLCHYVLKITPVFLCHYVILSKKSHLSPFVIMSLCLKKKPVSLRLSVTLSSKPPHLLLLSSCYSVLKNYPVPSVLMLLCLQRLSCLPSCRVFSCLKMYMFVFFINYLLFRCILSFFY